MNKIFALTLSGAILLSITAGGLFAKSHKPATSPSTSTSPTTNEKLVQIPNPFVDYETLEEAENAVGFKIKTPSNLPKGYKIESISAASNTLVQIIYKNGQDELYFRQAKGQDDISGDYNDYAQVTTENIGQLKITLKGNQQKISTATWTDGEFSFAIGTGYQGTGFEKTEVLDLIKGIQ